MSLFERTFVQSFIGVNIGPFTYLLLEVITIIVPTITNSINAANPIHIGESTQIQDQFITLHNFNTMNIIVNSPENPISPL